MIESGLYNGEVVWYNEHRGYGFIRIDEDEIFIHRSVLVHFGLTFLHSGDKVSIEVISDKHSATVSEIRAVSREQTPALPSDTSLAKDEVRGIVKFFNPLKGYGFIEVEDDEEQTDVFIHTRTLQACGLRGVAEGQKLLLSISDDGKGPQAKKVRIIDND